jgi:hypothetical protein
VLGERKNGHRRLHATTEETRLQKARLALPPQDPPGDFAPMPIARVENCRLTVQRAAGFGPRQAAPPGGALLLALKGTALVETSGGGARLETADLTVVPGGESYVLSAPESALVARVQAAD